MRKSVKLIIGMPVFNDIDFIQQSLYTIVNQTYKDWILIISDDGSNDGSQAICEKYAQKDKRITYLRQGKNLGISRNMQFLLDEAKAKYFMWAGDDDLMHPDYIKTLIDTIENTNVVSVFTGFYSIDENNEPISEVQLNDYSGKTAFIRLKKFIKNGHDAFGYGLFDREAIKGVQFPVWWWPNKKTPYNNIYPTLCYYLAKGDYVLASDKPLFYKRVKTEKKTNHILTGQGNGLKETLSYWIRKFNLACFSFKQIYNATGIGLSFRVMGLLFRYYFWKPSWKQFILVSKSFWRHKVSVKNN